MRSVYGILTMVPCKEYISYHHYFGFCMLVSSTQSHLKGCPITKRTFFCVLEASIPRWGTLWALLLSRDRDPSLDIFVSLTQACTSLQLSLSTLSTSTSFSPKQAVGNRIAPSQINLPADNSLILRFIFGGQELERSLLPRSCLWITSLTVSRVSLTSLLPRYLPKTKHE